MRVLVTSPAGLGHLHPLVPLARALAERGHDVLWATPADGVAPVEAAGLAAVAVAPPGFHDPVAVRRRFPELDALGPAEVPDALFGKLFGAVLAPAMLEGLAPVALDLRPDLVVADAAEFAGHVLAAELGVPSVTRGFGPLLPERRVAACAAEVATLWRARGLEPRPYGGSYDTLYLDPYPPPLQPDPPAHVPRRQLVRPLGEDAAGTGDGPLPLPEGRPGAPLVYVTMGTVFNGVGPLGTVVDAVAALDVRCLVTVGPRGDTAALGPRPAHVRVETYVPQTAVLPHCDAVVSHAGSGTVLAALAFGLPQLCLPQGADQFLNASAVAAAGAGLSLVPGQVDARSVGEAVARLLGEPSFAAAAAGVAAAIAAMPSPAEVAAVLEAVAGR